jgi:hypothetical protein
MPDDQWALEDLTRDPRLVGIYGTLPLVQGVAAHVVSNGAATPKKDGR